MIFFEHTVGLFVDILYLAVSNLKKKKKSKQSYRISEAEFLINTRSNL